MDKPGTGDLVALLERHLPVLRYDSQEPYFADSAAEWTDNPGNQLRRADGSLIAATSPSVGQTQLTLAFLGPDSYADGSPASAGDRIGDPAHDYVAQSRVLHGTPGYANRVYGHWATGGDGRVWLAYWFFYFYNDYNLVGPLLAAGLHEGDWEMIQLRLDEPGNGPDLAVYAQHAHAESRPWTQVERIGERPVVYPARGSHASYFNADIHWTGVWFDHANGKRPGPPLALEVILDDDPASAWAHWPGMWGGTEPKAGLDKPLEDSSPRGPGAHAQWHNPDTLWETTRPRPKIIASAADALPAPPTVSIARDGASLQIGYSTDDGDAAALIVAVNSPQEPLPPTLYHLPIDRPRGTLEVTSDLHADWGYDIHTSVATRDGRASGSTENLLMPNARMSTLRDVIGRLEERLLHPVHGESQRRPGPRRDPH